ncbi:putative Phosphatidylinositol-3 [Paratrimastix pyriformis]|uniref:protein-serine/threonine phosphatase n=1 Tax=Paratrimastix pyriformis TaxID=342808 RepID=A0ABQ8UWC0_9EUKA|nr:putative Phosphatidylinositol-3 [Paratrimastix pyriformis]
MQGIFNSVRKQITKLQKKQHTEITSVVDGETKVLDLSYILPNLIAMSFPDSGIGTIYRNNQDDVVAFFEQKHRDHFLIFNLAEEQYDDEKFKHRVRCFPFPDHHSPPLELIFRIVTAMTSYLDANKENVIAVHCLVWPKPLPPASPHPSTTAGGIHLQAGKGRTGTICSCYLLYKGLRAILRPQRGAPPVCTAPVVLGNLTMSPVPDFAGWSWKGIRPYAQVLLQRRVVRLSSSAEELREYPVESAGKIVLPLWVRVQGDVLIRVLHHSKGRLGGTIQTTDQLAFRMAFHTGFLQPGVWRLRQADLDEACKDTHHKKSAPPAASPTPFWGPAFMPRSPVRRSLMDACPSLVGGLHAPLPSGAPWLVLAHRWWVVFMPRSPALGAGRRRFPAGFTVELEILPASAMEDPPLGAAPVATPAPAPAVAQATPGTALSAAATSLSTAAAAASNMLLSSSPPSSPEEGADPERSRPSTPPPLGGGSHPGAPRPPSVRYPAGSPHGPATATATATSGQWAGAPRPPSVRLTSAAAVATSPRLAHPSVAMPPPGPHHPRSYEGISVPLPPMRYASGAVHPPIYAPSIQYQWGLLKTHVELVDSLPAAPQPHNVKPYTTATPPVPMPPRPGRPGRPGAHVAGGAHPGPGRGREGGPVLRAVAVADFTGTAEDELTFAAGDRLAVLIPDVDDSGWAYASLGGTLGLCPSTYLAMEDEDEPDEEDEAPEEPEPEQSPFDEGPSAGASPAAPGGSPPLHPSAEPAADGTAGPLAPHDEGPDRTSPAPVLAARHHDGAPLPPRPLPTSFEAEGAPSGGGGGAFHVAPPTQVAFSAGGAVAPPLLPPLRRPMPWTARGHLPGPGAPAPAHLPPRPVVVADPPAPGPEEATAPSARRGLPDPPAYFRHQDHPAGTKQPLPQPQQPPHPDGLVDLFPASMALFDSRPPPMASPPPLSSSPRPSGDLFPARSGSPFLHSPLADGAASPPRPSAAMSPHSPLVGTTTRPDEEHEEEEEAGGGEPGAPSEATAGDVAASGAAGPTVASPPRPPASPGSPPAGRPSPTASPHPPSSSCPGSPPQPVRADVALADPLTVIASCPPAPMPPPPCPSASLAPVPPPSTTPVPPPPLAPVPPAPQPLAPDPAADVGGHGDEEPAGGRKKKKKKKKQRAPTNADLFVPLCELLKRDADAPGPPASEDND